MAIIYHVTTERKAKKYRETGKILKPVRGFTTFLAAMAWAVKTGRKVIYQISARDECCYKLPDHHNAFADAWWADEDVPVDRIKCVFSAEKDG